MAIGDMLEFEIIAKIPTAAGASGDISITTYTDYTLATPIETGTWAGSSITITADTATPYYDVPR